MSVLDHTRRLDYTPEAFRLLPERQQEIARVVGKVSISRPEIEALQCECAIIGHAFYFYPAICSACGWES